MPIVSISKIANGGDGIATLDDGRVVFIPRALPGDTVEIEVVRARKSWARGKILRVIEPSSDRITADCKHFDVCGGCDFQHLRYDVELRTKAAAAREAFARISGLETTGDDVAGSVDRGYRIRTRWHTAAGILGYHRAGTHDVFALRECPVLHPKLQSVARQIAPVMDGSAPTLAAEISRDRVVLTGPLSHRVALHVMELDDIAGVKLNRKALGDVTISSQDAWGVDAKATLPPDRFRQSHGPMTATLRDLVARHVGTGEQLTEYFAGSGSFTHHLAAQFGEVTAYELDPMAVNTGNLVATELGHSTTFEVADLDAAAPLPAPGATVLLDPPRTGAAALCAVLASSDAHRIVYVACDIATLARDAKVLAENFTIERLDLVDMFPRTAHIEAVAVFARR